MLSGMNQEVQTSRWLLIQCLYPCTLAAFCESIATKSRPCEIIHIFVLFFEKDQNARFFFFIMPKLQKFHNRRAQIFSGEHVAKLPQKRVFFRFSISQNQPLMFLDMPMLPRHKLFQHPSQQLIIVQLAITLQHYNQNVLQTHSWFKVLVNWFFMAQLLFQTGLGVLPWVKSHFNKYNAFNYSLQCNVQFTNQPHWLPFLHFATESGQQGIFPGSFMLVITFKFPQLWKQTIMLILLNCNYNLQVYRCIHWEFVFLQVWGISKFLLFILNVFTASYVISSNVV